MLTYETIKKLCKSKGVTVTGLEKELGFARGSLCKVNTNKPSMEKVQKLADYFGVSSDALMTGEESESETPYYINDDAREMMQFMFENPEYKVLFDASRKISKSDIETVKAIMDKFRSADLD